MKVVLDTNILVSGVFFGGVPGRILDAWSSGRFEMFVTPSILDEYSNTLKAFGGAKAATLVAYWIAAITEHVHLVLDPKEQPQICRDPDDDKFLYCAAHAKVNYLVSGDKDLKSIEASYEFKIASPRTFLNLLTA